MAGAGYKLFVSGDVLTAAQVNTYLNEQTVMVFATSAARTSALSAVLAEGMMSYLQDSNTVFYYDGAAWNALASGDITAITAGNGITVTSGTGPVPTVEIDTAVTVDKTTAQTLTNKTLTSPALTTPTISTLTTNGDLLYGTGSGALSRLGIGSTSQVLTVTGGLPVWATPAGGGSALTYINGSSFSAVSSISIDSCFSATYQNYLIVGSITAVAGGTDTNLNFKLRASGTDATTNYFGNRVLANFAAAPATETNNDGTSNWALVPLTTVAGCISAFDFKVFRPFESAKTSAMGFATGQYDSNFYSDYWGGRNTNSTSYDGFKIYLGSGNFTGVMRIYGIANS